MEPEISPVSLLAAPSQLESFLMLTDIETESYMLEEGGALDVDLCPPCWELRAHLERYLFAARAFREMKVLDFGCGVGFGAGLLMAAGNQVVAIDSSDDARFRCNLRRGFYPLTRQWWPSEGKPDLEFDGCTALEVLEHLADPEAFVLTVPARHLIASVPIVPTVGINPHHTHDFTLDSFRALMERRFITRWSWTQCQPFRSDPVVAIIHGEERPEWRS